MITKGYVVEQSDKNPNLYKVRIPCLHGIEGGQHATSKKELPYAQAIGLPASKNFLHEGDCVVVGFDTNDQSVPIILGHLYAEEYNNEPIDLTLRRLRFDDVESPENVCSAVLPLNTTIGEIDKDNIRCLRGLHDNVQQKLDTLKEMINDSEIVEELAERVTTVESAIGLITNDIADIQTDIADIQADVSALDTRITKLEQDIPNAVIRNGNQDVNNPSRIYPGTTWACSTGYVATTRVGTVTQYFYVWMRTDNL